MFTLAVLMFEDPDKLLDTPEPVRGFAALSAPPADRSRDVVIPPAVEALLDGSPLLEFYGPDGDDLDVACGWLTAGKKDRLAISVSGSCHPAFAGHVAQSLETCNRAEIVGIAGGDSRPVVVTHAASLRKKPTGWEHKDRKSTLAARVQSKFGNSRGLSAVSVAEHLLGLEPVQGGASIGFRAKIGGRPQTILERVTAGATVEITELHGAPAVRVVETGSVQLVALSPEELQILTRELP